MKLMLENETLSTLDLRPRGWVRVALLVAVLVSLAVLIGPLETFLVYLLVRFW